MKAYIEFEDKPGYLRCHVTGTDSLDFSIEYFTRVADECRQRGFSNVLVVEELTGQLTTTDMFRLAEKLPKLFRSIRLAFVDMIPDHQEDNLFGETAGINRGLIAKVCADEKEAVDWLKNAY